MNNLIHNVEVILNNDIHISKLHPKLNLKFCKSNSQYGDGDFFCALPSFVNKHNLTPNVSRELVDIFGPWAENLIRFVITNDRITLFFNRKDVYAHCLPSILESGSNYGSSSLFTNELVCIETDIFGGDNLTELRTKYVGNLVSKLLRFSGCNVEENGNKSSYIGFNIEDKEDNFSTVHGNDSAESKILSPKNSPQQKRVIVISQKQRYQCDIHILVGVVQGKTGKASTIPVDEYLRLRRKQLVVLCENRGENSNCAEEIAGLEERMLHVIVTFDLLKSTIHRSVTLCLEPDASEKPSCKGALFVVYNFVRINKLCEKFDFLVGNGTIPPLPSFDEVDFSLLTEDDEWNLMYNFILYWPEVIKRCLEDFTKGRPKLHTILSFLTQLASDFSLYYHRIRILTEPRAHLLPVLYARIYVLKALKGVFQSALSILSIKPPSRM